MIESLVVIAKDETDKLMPGTVYTLSVSRSVGLGAVAGMPIRLLPPDKTSASVVRGTILEVGGYDDVVKITCKVNNVYSIKTRNHQEDNEPK